MSRAPPLCVSVGASGQHVDLQQAGDSVHTVEDAERKADVDDGCPQRVAVEVHLHSVAEVRPGSEGRHDPQLWGERSASGPGLAWPFAGHCCGFCWGLTGWGSQPSSLLESKGWGVVSGEPQNLGQGLALTKELRKCAQPNLPTAGWDSPCDHVSYRVIMAHLSDGEEGKKIGDVRIWYKRLNQQLSPGEMCAGWW